MSPCGSHLFAENLTGQRRPGKWSRQEEKKEQGRDGRVYVRETRGRLGVSGNKMRGQEKQETCR